MKRTIILLLAMLSLFALRVNAQLSITSVDTEFFIDFDNTVTDVNEGAFAGTGFATTPIAGQLDAEAWAVGGMSDLAGLKDFGVEATTGDYARGSSVGGVTTGGIYAFEVETGNIALGVQPSGADFSPGWIAFKTTNNTGQTINYNTFSYDVWVYNDADWSSSFNGEFSIDGITWGPAEPFAFTTPEAADATPAWVKTTLSFEGDLGFDLADGQTIYFRIVSDDVAGSGSRDEIAIDNITVNFSYKYIVSTFPFIENFDAVTVPAIPTYWTINDVDAGNADWISSFTYSHSANNSMEHDYSSNEFQDGWLITPALQIPSGNPYRLKFWSYNYFPTYYGKNSVLISTTGTDPTDFTEIWSPATVTNTWGETKLDLSAYSGQLIYIAFRYEGFDGHIWYLDDVTVEETPTETVDWCNLQNPGTGNVATNVTYDVYARVNEPGVTDAAGQGEGIECWIGYSDTNTDPSTWTNWVATIYNADDGNNDEYMGSLSFPLSGTYYYASRFSYGEGPYSYGGYSIAGGNFWDGIDNVSGVANVTAPLGGDCGNPIIVSLPTESPYSDPDQTNCGLYNSYENTCLESYDGGDDILYRLDITELSYLTIEMTTATTYTGIALLQGCPDVDGYECETTSTLSGAGTHTLNSVVSPGSYYLMIDTWPTPLCIPAFDLTITAATTDVCLPPTVYFTGIQQTEATVAWTPGFTETEWNLVYGAPGFDPETEGTPITNVTAPYNLTGLEPGTAYDLYVQSVCGDPSDWSEVRDFVTPCYPTSTFPWTEDFETVTTPSLPDCWIVLDDNSDDNTWQTIEDYGVSSSQAAGLYTDGYNGENNDWLILPQFTLTGNEQLKYSVRAMSTDEPNDYKVVLSTTGYNSWNFTEDLVPLTTVDWETMTEIAPIDLSAYTGDVYIAIHVPSGGLDGWYLFFDNFTLEEIPTCPIPTDLFVTDITANSAILHWTENGSATTWNIKGSDTPINPAVGPGTFSTSTSDNPFSATGLPAGTTLYWYVQADCGGGDVSEWSAQGEFATACEAVTEFPYFEGFEDIDMPNCWTILDEDGDNYEWTITDEYFYEGSQCTSIRWDASGNDDWLISQQFAINSDNLVLDFFARSEGTTFLEDYNVLISTTGTDPVNFTTVLENIISAPSEWQQKTYELADYGIVSGQNIYVAIQCVSVDEYYLLVDAFTIREMSDENDILTFSFDEQTGPATIDAGTHTVDIEVAMGTPLTALVPTFTISDNATVDFASGVAQDFSTDFVYTVTSESGIDQTWTVSVDIATALSSQKDIVTFELVEQTGPATIGANTVDIEVVWNADRSVLTPVITISDLATINPLSETVQNFTNPFVYTVKAEDLTTKDYTVNVTNAPTPLGANCDNPIIVDANALPYNDIAQTTCGLGNDYEGTCDLDYFGGEDIIYRLDVTSDVSVIITMTTAVTWTGISILDGCPDTGACLDYSTLDEAGTHTIEINLTIGSYYIIADTWPSPDCIDAFDLTIELAPMPEINVIDLNAEVADIEVCAGTLENDAISQLAQQIDITDADDTEYTVDLTWTIDSYNEVTPGDYNAIGTFELPAGVAQTDPATTLEVYATVTILPAPVVTCPAGFDVVTIDPVTLSGATPVGGEYSGIGVSGGVFDPAGVPLGACPIYYTYTDPITGCENECSFVINLDIPYPEITGIDIYDAVEDVDVCLGAIEADALALLVNQITISNANSEEKNVTLTWTIDAFDGGIAGNYDATGTFTLPAGVSQTDPETPLEVYAIVTVNALPVVTCPANDEVTTAEIIALSGALPVGGTYSGTGVIDSDFDPSALANGDYTITYTYTDPLTGCTNFCEFILTVNIPDPEIAGIDVDGDVEDVAVCLGAIEADALALLVTQITITDSESTEYVVDLTWTIDAFNGNIAGDYDATGTFVLPAGVVQTDPITPLEVTAVVTVNDLPVVTCPDNFSVTTEDVVALTGATPAGGTYSGTGVTTGNFDPSALANSDYTIIYTYTDPITGCTSICDFVITVDIDNSIITNDASAISIYPNPNNGLFNLNFSNVNGNVNYQIYDTKGSIIVDENIFSRGNTILEVSLKLTPGVYYVKMITETQTLVEKLVVE